MFRNTIMAVALFALAACGEGTPQPKSDHDLAVEAIKHSDTMAVVAAYFDCLADAAPRTSNDHNFLDFDRIEKVTKACGSEEEAMNAQIAATWGQQSKPSEMEARLRGLRNEARDIIRENPYQPPSVTSAEPS